MKRQLRIRTRNNFLVYLLLIAQIAGLGVLNSFVFLGRPISAYIRYVVFFMTFINLFFTVLERRARDVVSSWFFFSFSFTVLIGYIHSHDFMNVLIEASHYVTIIAIYYWTKRHDISVKSIMNFVYIIIPVLLITSILSSLGYLHGMNDSSGVLLRSSVDVDGTVGVITTLAAFHEICRKEKASILDFCEFIMGCLVVAFSISRGRIAVLLLCIVIYLVITIRCRNVSRFKKMLPLVLVGSLLCILFSDTVGSLLDQILIRFRMSSGDLNLTRRTDEIRKHIQLFSQYPFTGMGWGMLAKYNMYDHCSYSATLAFMGVIGGIPYLLWFLWYLVVSLVNSFREKNISNYHLSCIMICAVMLLAVANMAFNKTGGIWGMLIAYIALNDRNYKENE